MSTHGVTNKIIYSADHIQLGQFAFTAYETEQYVVCFMGTTEDYKVMLSIDFDMRTGVTTLGIPNIAKRSNIDVSFSNFVAIYILYKFYFHYFIFVLLFIICILIYFIS